MTKIIFIFLGLGRGGGGIEISVYCFFKCKNCVILSPKGFKKLFYFVS